MIRHKSIGPMLRNGELKFWTPVSFEVVEFVSHCALSGTVSAAPAARLRPAARHSIMRPATQRVV